MRRIADALARHLGRVSAVMLIGIVAVNAANVVGRYLISAPLAWGEEVMLFLMIGAVFLSVPAVTWEGGNIHMNVLARALPPRVRRALEIFADLVSCAVISLIAFSAMPLVVQLIAFDERSHAADIPMALPQSAVPIGFALAALALIARQLSGKHKEQPQAVQE